MIYSPYFTINHNYWSFKPTELGGTALVLYTPNSWHIFGASFSAWRWDAASTRAHFHYTGGCNLDMEQKAFTVAAVGGANFILGGGSFKLTHLSWVTRIYEDITIVGGYNWQTSPQTATWDHFPGIAAKKLHSSGEPKNLLRPSGYWTFPALVVFSWYDSGCVESLLKGNPLVLNRKCGDHHVAAQARGGGAWMWLSREQLHGLSRLARSRSPRRSPSQNGNGSTLGPKDHSRNFTRTGPQEVLTCPSVVYWIA